MTGWRERDGELPEFLLARRGPGGELVPAGSASLGLDSLQRTELLAQLAAREVRGRARRSRVRWAAPGVEFLVDAHGSPSGPVRDAIVRAFEVAQPRPGMDEFLTVAEVAAMLKLNEQTVRKLDRPGIAAGAASRPARTHPS